MFITCRLLFSIFFFFNDTATTEIYTLSLHDALPISQEELVTSFSHLRYRDPRLPHEPRDMKVRNGRGIANGIVQVMDNGREGLEDVLGRHQQFPVVAFKDRRHEPRIAELTSDRRVFRREPDREGVDRPLENLRHEGDRETGVETAAEKGPERDVRHHPLFRRGAEEIPDALHVALFMLLAPGFVSRDIPETALLNARSRDAQGRARPQLADVAEQRARRCDGVERQIL